MQVGDTVMVLETKRRGKIVEKQKSLMGKNIYIVQFTAFYSEGFFAEELKRV